MGIFYKEFALKKVLECGAAKSWKEAKVAEKVYLNAILYSSSSGFCGISYFSLGYTFFK